MSDDIVSRAKALAVRAHAGQVDKAGRLYIEHVARVAAAVSDDPVAEAVAWLAGSFAFATLNIADWPSHGRGFVAFFTSLFCCCIIPVAFIK